MSFFDDRPTNLTLSSALFQLITSRRANSSPMPSLKAFIKHLRSCSVGQSNGAVPAATGLWECLLFWNAGLAFLLPSEIPLAMPKLWLMRTRALFAVPLQEMTIPAGGHETNLLITMLGIAFEWGEGRENK